MRNQKNTFSDKLKLREFIPNRPFLKELFKAIFLEWFLRLPEFLNLRNGEKIIIV